MSRSHVFVPVVLMRNNLLQRMYVVEVYKLLQMLLLVYMSNSPADMDNFKTRNVSLWTPLKHYCKLQRNVRSSYVQLSLHWGERFLCNVHPLPGSPPLRRFAPRFPR